MAKDNTEKDPNNQVMILVRRGKRGYIVEAAGSNDPYPCLNASDIGEAVIEILDDPNQKTVEYSAPEANKRSAEPEEDTSRPEPEDGPTPGGSRPSGWTAGDEMIVGLAGNLLQRARKFSDW